MADPRELRKKRLDNEYRELMRINGSIIKIEPIGSMPYEKYKVIFNIRTFIAPAPTYRDSTICELTIPPNYPVDAPVLKSQNTPPPWHINWWRDGRWCYGSWNKEESLVNYLHRAARTLQNDPKIANPGSMANGDAEPFWKANKNNRRLVPCDTQVLPTLDAPETITIIEQTKPKITINQPQANKPKISILPKNN